ncbi:MAG: MazG family protein [Lachnospiraceae bacterium]|nr:MazG family protein [Lachnospiraceae bacterium]
MDRRVRLREQKTYTLEDFLEIIKILRQEDGCPWDREQTHESLRPCMMEEAAELVSSIRIFGQTGDAENMREELGDILLQVVMHSEIASEEGLFSWEDVVQIVSEKMVRRHPHVFGDVVADNSNTVLRNWDDIKKIEKEGKEWIESPLREIPYELPSLTRAPKIRKKIDKLYQKEASAQESIHNIQTMAADLEKEQNPEEIQRTIGEILWDLSNISRVYRIPQEQVLNDKIEDMIDFYEGPNKK